jgi:aryl-alcohol dehydrogenase-like predicted oxidoreductase
VSARLGFAKFCCLQPHYNLYERADFEAGLAALCRAQGLAVIPYFSLASGFLTGKYRTESDLAHRARGAGVKQMLNARGLRILAALDQVAQAHAATPAQVALRWLLEQGVTAPIASATDLLQLQELLRAPALALSLQDLRALDRASASDAALA